MKIVNYPHPSLRFRAEPIKGLDSEKIKQIEEMFDLMYQGKGLGLAGPQVILPFQVFVMNLTADPEQRDKQVAYINPLIVERHGYIEGEEGCLSFPGLYQKVRRAKQIRFKAYNLQGELIERTSETELESRVVQHEIDHLQGVLFIDKMGALGKLASRGAVKELEREYRKAQEKGEIPPDDVLLEQLTEIAARA